MGVLGLLKGSVWRKKRKHEARNEKDEYKGKCIMLYLIKGLPSVDAVIDLWPLGNIFLAQSKNLVIFRCGSTPRKRECNEPNRVM